MINWRSILTINLPITKCVVKIYDSLSIGESRQLQKLLMRASISLTGTEEVNSTHAIKFLDMQDEAFGFLFVEAFNEDKTKITDIDNPLKFLNDLPNDDGELIYHKISDVINHSNKIKEEKKS